MIIVITGSSSLLRSNLLTKLKDNKIIRFKGKLENKNLFDNWIKKNNLCAYQQSKFLKKI